jgi:hypothetical protein
MGFQSNIIINEAKYHAVKRCDSRMRFGFYGCLNCFEGSLLTKHLTKGFGKLMKTRARKCIFELDG